jgi:hypothetical protein
MYVYSINIKQSLLINKNLFYACQDFKHMHALIVSELRLHLLAATKSAPPENALSTGTLVALLIIKIIY